MKIQNQLKFLSIASLVAVTWVSVLVARSSNDRNVTKLPARNTGIPSLAEAKKALRDVFGGIGYAAAEGTPVTFRVGSDEFLFGGFVHRVSHPNPLPRAKYPGTHVWL